MDLEQIFQRQIQLNERINTTLYADIKVDQDKRRYWFIKFQKALMQESAEAIDSLNWKWWKKDPDNWDNIKIELIDILHFWVSMCTISGLTVSMLYQQYAATSNLDRVPTSLEDVFRNQETHTEDHFLGLPSRDGLSADEKRELFMVREHALITAAVEASQALHWEWWTTKENHWNDVNAALVKLFGCWVSLCLVASLTAADVWALYLKKNKLNEKRQDEGYKDGSYDKYRSGVEDNMIYVLEQQKD